MGHGKSKSGTLRFKCLKCRKTFTPRKKVKSNRYFSLFKSWISSSVTIESLSKFRGSKVSPSTLRRHFDKFLDKTLEVKPLTKSKGIYLKVDGKYFGHWGCVLVFKERQNIILWDFVLRESYFSYLDNFSRLNKLGYKVLGITSDWHGSIVSASKNRYPDTPHQRCLVHTQRFGQTYLTQHPETEAGIQLLEIVKFLNKIKTKNEKSVWIKWLQRFEDKYIDQLNERSYAVDHKHWWYTHKNLRRTFRALKMSLSNLFLYLDYPQLCKDTNGLEAEFKHLKQKLAVHKGLTRKRKISFINWYFYLKSKYYQKYHTF